MFAASDWYATLFSGFYMALFLMLVALMCSARWPSSTAASFRPDGAPRQESPTCSRSPRCCGAWPSPTFVRGVPLKELNGNIEYDGGFFDLLNPFALLGGLTFVAIFLTHGAVSLSLKTTGTIRDRAHAMESGPAWSRQCSRWPADLGAAGLLRQGVDVDPGAARGRE